MTTAPGTELAQAAALAGAAVLPAAEPLTLGTVGPGDPQVAAPFTGAVMADVDGPVPGPIGILVGQDLVDALASSPMGSLDLAAALQPAIDAIAGTLHGRAGAARMVATGAVPGELGGPFTVAFLHTSTVAAAIAVPDAVLVGAQNAAQSATLSQEEPPAPAPLEVPTAAATVTTGTAHRNGIELLHGVDMEVTVEIGRTRMTVRDLLDLTPGAVLELDRAAGSPADLLVNGRLIARGEVVVIDEDFGLRITEIAADAAVAG